VPAAGQALRHRSPPEPMCRPTRSRRRRGPAARMPPTEQRKARRPLPPARPQRACPKTNRRARNGGVCAGTGPSSSAASTRPIPSCVHAGPRCGSSPSSPSQPSSGGSATTSRPPAATRPEHLHTPDPSPRLSSPDPRRPTGTALGASLGAPTFRSSQKARDARPTAEEPSFLRDTGPPQALPAATLAPRRALRLPASAAESLVSGAWSPPPSGTVRAGTESNALSLLYLCTAARCLCDRSSRETTLSPASTSASTVTLPM
jgi:hypothetical protein